MADGNKQNQGEGQTLEQQKAQAAQQGGRLQGDPQAAQQRSGGQQQGDQQQGDQRRTGGGQQQQQGGQQQQKPGQPQGGQQDSFQRGVQAGEQLRRQQFDQQKQLVGERPQGVGGNPTPTQQENDEIGAGLRHVDDKQDDGSGPDPKFAFRRVVDADPDSDRRRGQRQLDADEQKGKYETR